jgi:tRNA pseudouridine65 synthase
LKIFFQNEDFVVVRKDWGEHVHQPENHDYWVPLELVLVTQLKKILGQKVYPIHRLDAPTRGLLIFALSSEAASVLNSILIEKKYFAVVRGWTIPSGRIEIELENDSTGDFVAACTDFVTRARLELPFAVGKKHATSRYSILEIELQTGRYHQIRRHLNRISHPIIGDREHGDSVQNRFFREHLKIPYLCLWARSLKFQFAGRDFHFQDEVDQTWRQIFKLAEDYLAQIP